MVKSFQQIIEGKKLEKRVWIYRSLPRGLEPLNHSRYCRIYDLLNEHIDSINNNKNTRHHHLPVKMIPSMNIRMLSSKNDDKVWQWFRYNIASQRKSIYFVFNFERCPINKQRNFHICKSNNDVWFVRYKKKHYYSTSSSFWTNSSMTTGKLRGWSSLAMNSMTWSQRRCWIQPVFVQAGLLVDFIRYHGMEIMSFISHSEFI